MSRLILTNCRYLDVETLDVVENKVIVIEGDRIESITDAIETSSEDETIDCSGKFLIPGLFDMHVHLNYEFGELGEQGKYLLRRKEDYNKLLAVKHVKQYLKIGVTTVRGCGGDTSLSSLRQLIEEGKLIGPRMKLALTPIVQPGNQEFFGLDSMIAYAKEHGKIWQRWSYA